MAPVSNVVAYWLMLHVIVIEMQNCNNFDQVTILVGQTRNNNVGQVISNLNFLQYHVNL